MVTGNVDWNTIAPVTLPIASVSLRRREPQHAVELFGELGGDGRHQEREHQARDAEALRDASRCASTKMRAAPTISTRASRVWPTLAHSGGGFAGAPPRPAQPAEPVQQIQRLHLAGRLRSGSRLRFVRCPRGAGGRRARRARSGPRRACTGGRPDADPATRASGYASRKNARSWRIVLGSGFTRGPIRRPRRPRAYVSADAPSTAIASVASMNGAPRMAPIPMSCDPASECGEQRHDRDRRLGQRRPHGRQDAADHPLGEPEPLADPLDAVGEQLRPEQDHEQGEHQVEQSTSATFPSGRRLDARPSYAAHSIDPLVDARGFVRTLEAADLPDEHGERSLRHVQVLIAASPNPCRCPMTFPISSGPDCSCWASLACTVTSTTRWARWIGGGT